MFSTSLQKVFNPFLCNAAGIQSARKRQWCIICSLQCGWNPVCSKRTNLFFAMRLESSLSQKTVVYNLFLCNAAGIQSARKKTVVYNPFIVTVSSSVTVTFFMFITDTFSFQETNSWKCWWSSSRETFQVQIARTHCIHGRQGALL